MKVLLDECIRRKLKRSLANHDCKTVPEAGLAGRTNGVLLSFAERAGFDVFLTMDKGLQYQQNLAGRRIAIVVLRSRSNRLRDLLPHMEARLLAMSSVQPGEVVRVGG
jgi:predicted nuclease of predicted toxin-antitoxin system